MNNRDKEQGERVIAGRTSGAGTRDRIKFLEPTI